MMAIRNWKNIIYTLSPNIQYTGAYSMVHNYYPCKKCATSFMMKRERKGMKSCDSKLGAKEAG